MRMIISAFYHPMSPATAMASFEQDGSLLASDYPRIAKQWEANSSGACQSTAAPTVVIHASPSFIILRGVKNLFSKWSIGLRLDRTIPHRKITHQYEYSAKTFSWKARLCLYTKWVRVLLLPFKGCACI